MTKTYAQFGKEVVEEFEEKFPLLECPAHEMVSIAFCICENLEELNKEAVNIRVFLRSSLRRLAEEATEAMVVEEKAMHWIYCKSHNGTTAPDILIACYVVTNGCRYEVSPAEAETWNAARAEMLKKREEYLSANKE